jgi:endonuclease III
MNSAKKEKIMQKSTNALLLKFNTQSAVLGARRETLKAVAARLGVSETKAAHIAINRLHDQLFHGGQDYDFPTKEQIQQAEASIPKGPTRTIASLSDIL